MLVLPHASKWFMYKKTDTVISFLSQNCDLLNLLFKFWRERGKLQTIIIKDQRNCVMAVIFFFFAFFFQVQLAPSMCKIVEKSENVKKNYL